jgi:succinyl-CoA synthetase beta subunit
MQLHEYQAKALFSGFDIPVPRGCAVRAIDEARAAATELGDGGWVVKAQVHAGGRGKAGGVRRADDLQALETAVRELLGTRLVTAQTDRKGLPVNVLLVEAVQPVARELYLSMVIDRARERIVCMASAAGGMDIETIAAEHPEQINSVAIDPVVGLQGYQCRRVGFALGLAAPQITALATIMQGLYRLFIEHDLTLAEINPLVVTDSGALLALDAKISLDENALYRQKPLAAQRDFSQENATENAARQHDLNYIALDGNIACMVNGAGLAMATMDLIKLHGGEPANFLDVGGGTNADKVAEAFKLIAADPNVQAILVNIFGGIVRCDLIAEGITRAVAEVGLAMPVVVRLEGTNVERGREILAASGLSIVTATDLTDAARQVVAAARKRATAKSAG